MKKHKNVEVCNHGQGGPRMVRSHTVLKLNGERDLEDTKIDGSIAKI